MDIYSFASQETISKKPNLYNQNPFRDETKKISCDTGVACDAYFLLQPAGRRSQWLAEKDPAAGKRNDKEPETIEIELDQLITRLL